MLVDGLGNPEAPSVDIPPCPGLLVDDSLPALAGDGLVVGFPVWAKLVCADMNNAASIPGNAKRRINLMTNPLA